MIAKILYTDGSGVARLCDYPITHSTVNERVSLSGIEPATGFQFRISPVGITNDWHCTDRQSTQWVIVTAGKMRVGLRDGASHDFFPGDMFLSMDVQPGERFEPTNGHTSASVGDEPLQTFFVKVPFDSAQMILSRALALR